MRVLLQRVSRASVRVDGATIGRIDAGLLLLLGIRKGDTEVEARWLAKKVAGLRVFAGNGSGFDSSVQETGGALLVVSQFTLYGETRKGRRPNFGSAEAPERADTLVSCFIESLRDQGLSVETGRFGAMMEVESVNDGPVTLILEREAPAD